MIKPIVSVGFNKYGEVDFEVSGAVYDLTTAQINELAAMCMLAFHIAYGMRDREGQTGSPAQTGEPRKDDYEETKAKTGFAAGTRRFRKEEP